MKWRLDLPHHIDEQVLEAGTIIGDDTQWPFRAAKADPKIGRKVGDALPPSTNMSPLDDEARKVYEKTFGKEGPTHDPLVAVPLTGAPGAPRVRPPEARPVAPPEQKPVNQPPVDPPKTGILAESPKPTPAAPATPTPKV